MMNVTDRSALQLIRSFARIEYALKSFPEFTRGAPGDVPDAQWTAFYVLVRNSVEESVRPATRDVLLGNHPNNAPPMKMDIGPDGRVRFRDQPLLGPIGDRLMDAARRVRNNLVHGGKEFAAQERYRGHDQQLVEAATDVIFVAAAAHPDVARLFFID
jgi:hypothetical protein